MNYTNNTTCSPREQVIRNVLQLIRKQELPPDAEVPAENLLAERFGVARGTVRSGLAELAARGILEKRGRRMHVVSRPAGRGTFLMNRTVILLSSTDKDDAIRKRNSGFMDAIQAGALEELMAQNMHSLWLNGSRLTSGELEELTQIRPGGALFFSSAHPRRNSMRRRANWPNPACRRWRRFTRHSSRRSIMCCRITPREPDC